MILEGRDIIKFLIGSSRGNDLIYFICLLDPTSK
jgi:hypothetical protein